LIVYKTQSFFVPSNYILPTSLQAGKTLSARKWQAAFSPDGCLDIASVLSRIQRGVRFLSFIYAPCPPDISYMCYVHLVMFTY